VVQYFFDMQAQDAGRRRLAEVRRRSCRDAWSRRAWRRARTVMGAGLFWRQTRMGKMNSVWPVSRC
jgi:hypothetical protein